VNLPEQLARLQLGASGARHRPSRRLDDAPPISTNASSVSQQRSSVRRGLLSTLHCPARGVWTLVDEPEAPITGQPVSVQRSGPVFEVAYAHTKNLLVAVDEEGAVGVLDAVSGRRKSLWMAHHNAIFDVIWTQDDTQVLTAAGDLEIRVWDVETAGTSARAETKPVATLKGHDMSVKCVRHAPDSPHVFVSGGRDGRVLLWDTRATGNPVSSLENVHAEPTPSRTSSPNVSFASPIPKRRRRGTTPAVTSASPRSVTCVEFGVSGQELVTAGAVDAVVKFWDLRRVGSGNTSSRGKKVAAKVPVPTREISCSTREGSRRGISSLSFRPGGAAGASHLLVNVLNDAVAVIDTGRKQHSAGFREARTVLRCAGHQVSSFYSKATFSPDGDFIAGASADGVVYVWDAGVSSPHDGAVSSTWSGMGGQQRTPCFALKGHVNEVNGVSWSSRDFTQLASCSDDGTIRRWQVGDGFDQHHEGTPFELHAVGVFSEASSKVEWANWSAFVGQPDGYAYRVRANAPAPAPQARTPSSPRRQCVCTTDRQRASPQVTRHSDEPRLHPVHERPTAQQPQQEAQEAQPKRRIKLKRKKTKPSAPPKRAQRTLLELWGQ
jgi:WD40 repeat protein